MLESLYPTALSGVNRAALPRAIDAPLITLPALVVAVNPLRLLAHRLALVAAPSIGTNCKAPANPTPFPFSPVPVNGLQLQSGSVA